MDETLEEESLPAGGLRSVARFPNRPSTSFSSSSHVSRWYQQNSRRLLPCLLLLLSLPTTSVFDHRSTTRKRKRNRDGTLNRSAR